MTRVYLEYQDGGIELPIGESVIGRDVGCTLRFNDPSVSRRHLRIVRRHADVFAQDLSSTNGTLVNGRSLTLPVRIDDGDQLQLGGRRIVVRVKAIDDDLPDTVLTAPPVNPAVMTARPVTSRMPLTVPPPTDTFARSRTKSDSLLRRHDRRRYELQLVYVSEELEIEATTRDLSLGGVFVCTQLLDPVGTQCQLTLLVDGGPPLKVPATVRRVVGDAGGDEPVGMGVEFGSLGAIERAWLEKTVARISA